MSITLFCWLVELCAEVMTGANAVSDSQITSPSGAVSPVSGVRPGQSGSASLDLSQLAPTESDVRIVLVPQEAGTPANVDEVRVILSGDSVPDVTMVVTLYSDVDGNLQTGTESVNLQSGTVVSFAKTPAARVDVEFTSTVSTGQMPFQIGVRACRHRKY